jgi:hypothetical protein
MMVQGHLTRCPLLIEILIACHCRYDLREHYIGRPGGSDMPRLFKELLAAELVTENERLTEKGVIWLREIIATPLPVPVTTTTTTWEVPR